MAGRCRQTWAARSWTLRRYCDPRLLPRKIYLLRVPLEQGRFTDDSYLMLQASSQFRVPLMFAGLAVIAVMGIATYAVFAVLEARVTGWATRGQNTPLSGGG